MILSKIIRSDLEISPSHWPTLEPELRAQSVDREVFRNGRTEVAHFWKLGAIIPDPPSSPNSRGAMLVRMGVAVPANAECQEAAGMTPLQMAAAQKAQDRTRAGIHPEDFDLYDAGMIIGYSPDGSNGGYLPGPNWEAYLKRQAELEDEEDE